MREREEKERQQVNLRQKEWKRVRGRKEKKIGRKGVGTGRIE